MSQPAAQPELIAVPGSIANLGPAFDALSVAVRLYLTVTILERLPDEPGLLDMAFETAPPPGENRVALAFERAARRYGTTRVGVRVAIHSDIPMRAGLGSSAAATIAGLRLYEAVTAPRSPLDWLAVATEIEGHPDNAAAALLGGLALSCQFEDGRVEASSWAWPEDLRFVVATPVAQLSTSFAREVLPDTIPLRDAVFNLQRALRLVRALESRRYAELREGLADRWHQPAREPYVPALAEALALDHPSVLGVCLSGAGPSIAVLAADRHAEAAGLLAQIYERLGVPYTIRTLAAHPPQIS